MRINKTLVLVLIVFISSCKKQDSFVTKDYLAMKYSKYCTMVYHDASLTKKVSTIEKGEPVYLLDEIKIKNGKTEKNISKIRLTDGTISYLLQKNLAIRPVVFLVDDFQLYKDANPESGIAAVVASGTIGFIIKEKANWAQVDIEREGNRSIYGAWIKPGKKMAFGEWIKGETSNNNEIIADAVSLERINRILEGTIQGDKDDAMKILQFIAQKQHGVGKIAETEILKMGKESKPQSLPNIK